MSFSKVLFELICNYWFYHVINHDQLAGGLLIIDYWCLPWLWTQYLIYTYEDILLNNYLFQLWYKHTLLTITSMKEHILQWFMIWLFYIENLHLENKGDYYETLQWRWLLLLIHKRATQSYQSIVSVWKKFYLRKSGIFGCIWMCRSMAWWIDRLWR